MSLNESKVMREAPETGELYTTVYRRMPVTEIREGKGVTRISHPVEIALAAIGTIGFVNPQGAGKETVEDSMEFVFGGHKFTVTIELAEFQ